MARQTARGRARASAVSRKRRTQKRVVKAAGSRAKSRGTRPGPGGERQGNSRPEGSRIDSPQKDLDTPKEVVTSE